VKDSCRNCVRDQIDFCRDAYIQAVGQDVSDLYPNSPDHFYGITPLPTFGSSGVVMLVLMICLRIHRAFSYI